MTFPHDFPHDLSDISTHMPLARHDEASAENGPIMEISTHMPLARHDLLFAISRTPDFNFYSHASCEA